MDNKTLVIVVAGGKGLRLSANQSLSQAVDEENISMSLPKQYMLLGEHSILERVIKNFTCHPAIDHVMVVIHPEELNVYNTLVSHHSDVLPPVSGGETRQQSVYSGLLAARQLGFTGKILIHDAVRPFVTKETIAAVLENIEKGAGSIAAHPLSDTLKQCNDKSEVLKTIARGSLFCAQTPQGFMAQDIMDVHDNAIKSGKIDFTDDAAMFEAAGLPVRIIHSPCSNFKITTVDDLDRARLLVEQSVCRIKTPTAHADIRIGNGYDTHALKPGDGLILCGCKIPFDKKSEGHSDADVGLHALTDAILGAIGESDIGTHFPSSDPQWKNASSSLFLMKALKMTMEKGCIINNLDITIICEAPRIAPYRKRIQKQLACLCSLEVERISIKATTNEKMGFIGRGEGIAAIATVSLLSGVRNLP